ncbi:tRNA pseudouridine(55) synthase TruB [bacterium]|nr:tRNA pseudouridine(55) synthase TruB [bacterium]
MDKLLVVNKEKNLTSRDIVNNLTKIFNTKKIGHTGTLDPIATGVLVCLFGKYTKLVDLLTSLDKEYIAEIKLGIKTDTGDITGSIIENKSFNITKDNIIKVFEKFPQKYEQTVPKYSAVKINGKKLYEYARNNIEIELPKREVSIFSLELIDYEKDIIKFKTHVSKGTYIRSLIEDICEKLGTIGTMNNLIRTKQGGFDIEDSFILDDIKNGNFKFQNIHEFLKYPSIEINDELIKIIKNGGRIKNIYNVQDKVIFTYQGEDIAIYETNNETLKPYIMF